VTTSRTRRTAGSPKLARTHLLGVELSDRVFIPEIRDIPTGTTASEWLRVPTADAQRLLRAVARLVADLPRDSSQDVVWTLGASELLVRTGRVTVGLATGLVTVGIPVECDQVDPTIVSVPLAVGTTEQVRGLFVSTFDKPLGPTVVTDIWADALTAFAWESVITLAQHLAAESGRDRQGRVLVPAAVAAERGAFLVKPMARNEL
jgi:hypothetical protein